MRILILAAAALLSGCVDGSPVDAQVDAQIVRRRIIEKGTCEYVPDGPGLGPPCPGPCDAHAEAPATCRATPGCVTVYEHNCTFGLCGEHASGCFDAVTPPVTGPCAGVDVWQCAANDACELVYELRDTEPYHSFNTCRAESAGVTDSSSRSTTAAADPG